ncbi:MAG: nucleotidyl transferase AbiEii/AbiGii toxin family protein [Flavobacteriales bacterium]|nr:nucleotidyl transferase AbiEii/AbiGii toxin family protein [Flavobacteriales bacterium]
MNYLELFQRLEEQQIKYLICGGLAMNLHGIPRMTADIDLLIEFSSKNLSALSDVLAGIGYQKSIPIELESLKDFEYREKLYLEKDLIAFSFFNPSNNTMAIDLLVKTPKPFAEYWENKIVRKAENHQLYLISVDDLLEMKTFANRAQDRSDVKSLLKLIKNG